MNHTKIDFRSDTVTKPTPAMRQAMANAEVGDDVYGDDPTVNRLEVDAAEILGKEAALFTCSGTMANQLALLSQVKRGQEIILPDQSHIVCHEAGAAAFLSGAQLRCLPSDEDGCMNIKSVEATIRKHPEDIHSPETALICYENADSNGRVLPVQYMKDIYFLADKYHLPVHLDGARLFNAADSMNAKVQELASYAHTVQICLSKGLCAPVGSILAGPKTVIKKARQFRKILGGGLRQAGVLAAPGLIALHEMRRRLGEDHKHAKWIADELKKRSHYFNVCQNPQINMVFFTLRDFPTSSQNFVKALAAEHILINPPDEGVFRLVTHYWTDDKACQHLMNIIDEILK